MKFKISFILVFMLSVFLSAQNLTDDRELNIDSIDNVFEMAKLYEEQNDFVSAVKEYKRVLFLQDYFKIQNYKNNVFCLEKLSDYYYKNNQYELALSYINDGLNSCIADQQLINKFLINKINISVKLLKNYELLRNDVALYALAFIDDCDIQIKKQILFEILRNDLLMSAFDKFIYDLDYVFALFGTDDSDYLYSNILLQLNKLNNMHLKNPKLAAGLSIIPGLGQMYAGDFSDGVNSLIINGSLIALSAYSLINFHFIEFSFFEFSPLYRFYRGNFYNAQKDSYDYNKKKTAKIQNEIIDLLRKILI